MFGLIPQYTIEVAESPLADCQRDFVCVYKSDFNETD